jgi:acetyltransferase-like isoleucine patch superfamily enzyme
MAWSHLYCTILFYGQNVSFKKFKTEGIPYVSVANGGKCSIGSDLRMNNKLSSNPIGCPQPCLFFVDKQAVLTIGNNLGISQAAIICHLSITIGDNVKIGGGVSIYDTDFHCLLPEMRKDPNQDLKYKEKKPVIIKNNAFIGAHSIILKGVTIGENSVVGAGSVVTKSIPDNQVWAGNPAKLIKEFNATEIGIKDYILPNKIIA